MSNSVNFPMSGHEPCPVRLWTIYKHPLDYPQSYVARLFEGERPTGSIVVAPTLALLRDQMIAMWLTRIPRQPADDPVIVEVWV
jgi:hypothetical protein